MRVSYQWLKEYIDLSGVSPEELAELMTRGGIEIDTVEQRNQGVSNVVVGHVLEKEKHPDADKLSVCKVDAGTGETLQIVCGAPNVAAGQKVPVALIGAKLPGGIAIKRAKLRGVESQGMICSAKELGINDKLLPKDMQEGILVLPADSEIGTPITEYLALDDAVLELDLTPNRSDCLSMLGVAYEAAALTGRQVKLPDTRVESGALKAADKIAVTISAPEHCFRYAARYVQGVKIGPSPQWMQNRLIAAGVRPINNIVDITNYVMLEYGQPLHAFDADKLGGRIEVRLARPGETMVTLDDQERKLDPDMLLITDGERPVALAGVMGGANTEVSDETVNVVLESAEFDAATVRRTSRRLGLRSEASLRFEKGVDPARVVPAVDRAAALMALYAGGTVLDGIVQAVVREAEPAVVSVTLAKINGHLGTSLTADEVQEIFGRLGFESAVSEGGVFTVKVPTRRGDISRDVDLIEEVARLHGYDNIPSTAIEGSTTAGRLTGPQAIRRALRAKLADAGLQETFTYSLTHPSRTRMFTLLAEGAVPIRVAMPMSEDRSELRTSLVPSLIDAAIYNRNRKNTDLKLFEIGSVFLTDEQTLTRLPQERHRIAGLLTGSRTDVQWNVKAEPVDFYDAKGVVETIFDLLGVSGRIRYEAAALDNLHPGRSAKVLLDTGSGEMLIGYVGQLHPSVQLQEELDDTYVFELALEPLYEHADTAIIQQPLPRYPSVERDLAVLVDRSVEAGSLLAAIREAGGDLLESVSVFDVYVDDRLGADKKSVAFSLVYRHPERTLTDDEAAGRHAAVLDRLASAFGAELRK
jgi:phenylalanyl-tRNA synthetase beta chain